MEYAKAMYWGGRVVFAYDDDVDHFTYLEKGLLCPECNEQVFLKKGDKKSPHFAHFPATPDSRLCDYRITGYSGGWSSLTLEGRNQRSELFKKHFLKILAESYKEFNRGIKIIKDRIKYRLLNKFIQVFYNHFYKQYNLLIKECKQEKCDDDSFLQILITCEAIKYLSVENHQSVLEELVYYSLYEICITTTEKWNDYLTKIQPNEISQKIKNILSDITWLSVISPPIDRNNDSLAGLLRINEDSNSNKLKEKLAGLLVINNGESDNFQIFKRCFKLRKDELNIKLCFKQINDHLILTTKAFTIAQIIGCKENSGRIVVKWKIIYSDIQFTKLSRELSFYKFLRTEIDYFFGSIVKDGTNVFFNLTNWEEIVTRNQQALKKAREPLEKGRIKKIFLDWKRKINFIRKQVYRVCGSIYDYKKKVKCPHCESYISAGGEILFFHVKRAHINKIRIDFLKEKSVEILGVTNPSNVELHCPICERNVFIKELLEHLISEHSVELNM